MDRNKLQTVMIEKNISIRKLSIKTNIDRSVIQKILNGTSKNVTIQTVAKIAKALGVQIEELLLDELI